MNELKDAELADAVGIGPVSKYRIFSQDPVLLDI